MELASIRRYTVRHAYLFKAGLLGFFAVLILLGVLIPMLGRIGTLNTKLKSKTKEAEELTNKVAILTNLDPSILDKRVVTIDSALPPKKDVLLYLSTIDGLSRELELSFNGISLSPGDVTSATVSASARKQHVDVVPGVHSLETQIKISGERESVYAFLRTIEQSLPLMEIKDVKVSVSNDQIYSLSLTLGMLWAGGDVSSVKGTISIFDDQEERYFTELESYRKFEGLTFEDIPTDLGKSDLFAPNTIEEPQVQEVTEAQPATGAASTSN